MFVWPRRYAPHPARVVEMRKRASIRALAGGGRPAPHPATAIYRRLGLGTFDQSRRPLPARTRRTGCPRWPGRGLIAVIPLTPTISSRDCGSPTRALRRSVDGDGGLDDRVVSPTSAPCRPRQSRRSPTARCVRPSNFDGGSPVCVRGLLLLRISRARASRDLDPRGRATETPGPVSRRTMLRAAALSVVANRDGLTLQPASLDESLLHPRKDGPVRSRSIKRRGRRMIGWRLVHAPQKAGPPTSPSPRHASRRSESMPSKSDQLAPGCRSSVPITGAWAQDRSGAHQGLSRA